MIIYVFSTLKQGTPNAHVTLSERVQVREARQAMSSSSMALLGGTLASEVKLVLVAGFIRDCLLLRNMIPCGMHEPPL